MKAKLMLLTLTLLIGCSEWLFAPTVLATYVLENQDPQNRPIVMRLFTADQGLAAEYKMGPGMIIQDQKEIQTLESYRHQRYQEYKAQVVWTVSIITSISRDSVVDSKTMDLFHGRTARIIWNGKLKVQGLNVPVLPDENQNN